MKLAFLTAANSIHGIRWVSFFAGRCHKVTWISLAPPIPEADDLLKKTRFCEIKPSPLADINGLLAILNLPSAVKQVKKILNETKPDLLHVHSAGTYGLVGAFSGFHPTILTPWGSDILLTTPPKLPLVKFVVRNADRYTCDGENTRQKLIELGAAPKKISLIRFGTDVEKFKPATTYNLKHTTFKIISLRSLIPVYDIEALIKAAKTVVLKFPKTEFLLAGEGVGREKLENLSRQLGLQENVRFLGKIRNEELPTLLQSADIYASTALSDSGLAAGTAEAMASGLPVVVTDTGDNNDWIDNEFVVPVKSPELLAEKIIALMKNEGLRKNQGIRNRRIIEEKNNYHIEMTKVENLYENIVKNG